MSTNLLVQFEELGREIDSEPLDSHDAVDQFRIRFLSRKQGQITQLLKQIPAVAQEQRKEFGKQVNRLKQRVEDRITIARSALQATTKTLDSGIDLSLPGRRPLQGSIHPLTQTLEDIKRVFASYGFSVAEGPEIEDDWHNFTALNFPPDHPARDMQDTFFLEPPESERGGILLRTHTSPVQIRTMESQQPPYRVIVPGRVYRNEAISYKSYCLFHQVEGLCVDEHITLGDLKQMLYVFSRAMFGQNVKMRFRPSFFPFTEPSAEVDIWWPDAKLPRGGRWLEILGCGMVDPNVFASVDVDPEKYTGYAFGMGIERIAMLRHDISDIRILYENDTRFLEQF